MTCIKVRFIEKKKKIERHTEIPNFRFMCLCLQINCIRKQFLLQKREKKNKRNDN